MHPPINFALSTVIVPSSHQAGQSCGRGWAVINETLFAESKWQSPQSRLRPLRLPLEKALVQDYEIGTAFLPIYILFPFSIMVKYTPYLPLEPV